MFSADHLGPAGSASQRFELLLDPVGGSAPKQMVLAAKFKLSPTSNFSSIDNLGRTFVAETTKILDLP